MASEGKINRIAEGEKSPPTHGPNSLNRGGGKKHLISSLRKWGSIWLGGFREYSVRGAEGLVTDEKKVETPLDEEGDPSAI